MQEALRIANEKGLDLVEIAPNANPPVCKILDYGKFLYELKKKEMSANRPKVTEEDVAEVVARWTSIPVKRIHESDMEKLLHIEEELHK